MAKLNLIVTLRREVPDQETGEQLFQIVVQRLADHPEVKITGQITSRLPEETPS